MVCVPIHLDFLSCIMRVIGDLAPGPADGVAVLSARTANVSRRRPDGPIDQLGRRQRSSAVRVTAAGGRAGYSRRGSRPACST